MILQIEQGKKVRAISRLLSKQSHIDVNEWNIASQK